MSYRMSIKIDKKNKSNLLTTISTCHFNGLEINFTVGDILTSNTMGIGAICDSRFSCAYGLAKHLKDAVGNEFAIKLHQARQRQQNSNAIAISNCRNSNVQTDFIILAPTRTKDRNSLQTIYIAIIDKAKELNMDSLTIPFLGTGQLGLTQNEAGNFLLLAFSQITTFGSLQKLQFIDQSEGNMVYLRNLITDKFTNTDQRVMHHQSTSRQQQRHKPYLIPDPAHSDLPSTSSRNNAQLPSTSSYSSSTAKPGIPNLQSHKSNLNININISIDDTGNNPETDDSDDISIDSDLNPMFSDDSSEMSDMDDEEISDVGDEEESSIDDEDDDDAGFSTDDDTENFNNTSFDLDELVGESSTENEKKEKSKKKRCEEEERFWSLVSIENLRKNNSSHEKPSTSKSTQKQHHHPNLDDTSCPCSICLSDMREETEEDDNAVIQLSLCSHMFHQECIRAAFKVKKQCPLCMCWYGSPIGYQPPDATMMVRQVPGKVNGHPNAKGFHEIQYNIPPGIQTEGHIRPGEPYRASTRIAYLPNNEEGTHVLKLLQLAFKRRLIFTIGDSVTTGRKNVPIWNGIHHKTNKDGGTQCYGYPDPGYLDRVKEELALVGVRSEQLTS